ncbi:DNA-binding protein [Mesoplasma florum]|uniref:YlxM family DNA-binding protein n=1 Tax=Mesoplasma florum TaxID=2151 RepID=UPI000BE45A92|nr:YlxM family DNA-binding protein [Mesoplasma florum]ATI73880.1 DNA-binding protein [Mesoplasma florum]AVN64979.1 DNA-binding protein [Mesoplasma florum]
MSKITLEKTLELSSLFYLYKNMLTEKQIEYFELYFEEDLSFQEIADQLGISKAAAHDAINKIIKSLNDLEDKLQLNHKKIAINELLEKNKNSKNEEVLNLIKKIEEVI